MDFKHQEEILQEIAKNAIVKKIPKCYCRKFDNNWTADLKKNSSLNIKHNQKNL